jgi:MFS family permease
VGELKYRNYLLIVMLTVLAFSGADTVALGLVFQDIKKDLNLSDIQLSILTSAYAVSYAVFVLPMGRWVDRGNRVLITSLTNAVWSVALLLCSLITNFLQLLIIRIGVAVGQSGCQCPAYSLVPDYFDRAERPRAVALYMLGGPLSYVIGYFIAGWINELFGWRTMFVALGLPGLAVVVLSLLTLREPRLARSALETASSAPAEKKTSASPPAVSLRPTPSLRETCATLWSLRTFRHLLLYSAVFALFNSAMLAWVPTFFIRSFGTRTGELGGWLALIYGGGGVVGTYLGGAWASRYAVNNERLQFMVAAIVYGSLMLFSVGIFLSTDSFRALSLLAINTVGATTVGGPQFATLQTLVPKRMRATSVAFVTLCAMLIGGLGPLLVGALSDALRLWGSGQSLRYALLALCPGYVWAAWHLWRASNTVVADLKKAQENHAIETRNTTPQQHLTGA